MCACARASTEKWGSDGALSAPPNAQRSAEAHELESVHTRLMRRCIGSLEVGHLRCILFFWILIISFNYLVVRNILYACLLNQIQLMTVEGKIFCIADHGQNILEGSYALNSLLDLGLGKLPQCCCISVQATLLNLLGTLIASSGAL